MRHVDDGSTRVGPAAADQRLISGDQLPAAAQELHGDHGRRQQRAGRPHSLAAQPRLPSREARLFLCSLAPCSHLFPPQTVANLPGWVVLQYVETLQEQLADLTATVGSKRHDANGLRRL